jgi:hypothetical protein
MPKKRKPTKRHPHVKRAIANIEKLQKGHKKMVLDLENAKKRLQAMPFGMPFGTGRG